VTAHGGGYLHPDRADVTVTHLDFPGGVRGHIFVSWLHPEKEHRLVVIGDRRMAVFTDDADGGRLVVSDGVPPRSGESPPPPRNERVVPFPKSEPLKDELLHFLHCVRTREEPLSGGRHGLDVLRVLETAQKSLGRGGHAEPCPAVVQEAEA
jgi:UDP-2-acetamido-3-amino-2,3-dideoxy-glucuronate N-acetyltransferase